MKLVTSLRTEQMMKLFKRIILSKSLAFMFFSPVIFAETFTVGVVPQFDIKTIYSIWQPILNVIEQKTGHKFVLKGSKDIPTFEKDFSMGVFDFAYMNPYHYTISKHYQPIIKDHGRKLYGILTVSADSNMTDISELNDQTIVFPAPNALGASLMIRSELVQKYGISFTPKYVNTHSSVYLNVALGLASAGGGVQKTYNQQNDDLKAKLKVLLKTDTVEPHPFVARKDLDPKWVEEVISAMLEMGQNVEENQLLAKVPFKKIGIATDADYEQVRNLNLDRYYVSPN